MTIRSPGLVRLMTMTGSSATSVLTTSPSVTTISIRAFLSAAGVIMIFFSATGFPAPGFEASTSALALALSFSSWAAGVVVCG